MLKTVLQKAMRKGAFQHFRGQISGIPRQAGERFLLHSTGDHVTAGIVKPTRSSGLGILMIDAVDHRGQFFIFIRHHIARVVRGELDIDGVPHIAPTGVVVLFFGMESDFRHKRERFRKVLKFERRLQAIFFFVPHSVLLCFESGVVAMV